MARLSDAARESALRESVSPRFRADSRAATLEPCRALADLLISKPGSRLPKYGVRSQNGMGMRVIFVPPMISVKVGMPT